MRHVRTQVKFPKAYRFDVEGGSPGPGTIVVVAYTEPAARRAAQEKIDELNARYLRRGQGTRYALGEFDARDDVTQVNGPTVVYVDDGER